MIIDNGNCYSKASDRKELKNLSKDSLERMIDFILQIKWPNGRHLWFHPLIVFKNTPNQIRSNLQSQHGVDTSLQEVKSLLIIILNEWLIFIYNQIWRPRADIITDKMKEEAKLKKLRKKKFQQSISFPIQLTPEQRESLENDGPATHPPPLWMGP